MDYNKGSVNAGMDSDDNKNNKPKRAPAPSGNWVSEAPRSEAADSARHAGANGATRPSQMRSGIQRGEKKTPSKPVEPVKKIEKSVSSPTVDLGVSINKTKKVMKSIGDFVINRDAIRPDDIIRVKGGIDRPMLIIIVLLICFGSVMVFSASYVFSLSKYGDSYYFIRRQILFVVFGAIVMIVVSMVDYTFIRRFVNLYFVAAVMLLLLVLVIGVAAGKAQRWLYIGSISVQPSEVMKLGIVLVLANYFYKYEKKIFVKKFWPSSFFGTFVPIAIIGFVCVLVALENHISGTIIMFLIGVLMIFAAGGRKFWLVVFGIAGILGIAVVVFATGYATKRIDIWLHPENYSAQNEVWQTLQGLYAVGSGGFFGVGLGNSRQKNLFVSQPQNDFIYSILCEELGFVGAVLVIVLFLFFIWRGYKIAMRAPDTFSRLAVIGIVGKVGIQALLNIAVVTGSIPNTGITLPFFSYGGSSLLMLMAEMGIVLSISRFSKQVK